MNIQTLQQSVLELWKADQLSAVELGKALIRLRAAMKAQSHGAFKKWYTEQGLPTNRVYYCIREAEGKDKRHKEETADGPEKAPRTEELFTDIEWQGFCRFAKLYGKEPIPLLKEIILEWQAAHPLEVEEEEEPLLCM